MYAGRKRKGGRKEFEKASGSHFGLRTAGADYNCITWAKCERFGKKVCKRY